MRRFFFGLCIFWGFWQAATADAVRPEVLQVWVSEAAVALYTWNPDDLQTKQSRLAHYFTSQAWIDFNKAQAQSGMLKAITTHHYTVSAVPLHPPKLMALGEKRYEAILPLLVSYTNPEYEQQQTLKLKIRFEQSDNKDAIRGLAITAIESKPSSELCACRPSK